MRKRSDAIIPLYQRHGFAWDADRRASGWNDRVWHDRFVALLPKGASVLDLGCGGGDPVAANLIANGFSVTGVDASEPLIDLCRARFPAETFICADMRTLALDRAFAGILAWDSFFHLDHDDQRRMFDVFAHHASPGTLLMLNTGPAHGEAIGTYRGDELYHASLDPQDYRDLLASANFDVLDARMQDASAGGRSVWLARRR
ncbi:MAG: class I SAM-dependent methyltransferase [Hyphomicrobiales bacterium]|nr:MAG: class I SAM-dependent methyltransferase [Hyphomicrobiales bacterium]